MIHMWIYEKIGCALIHTVMPSHIYVWVGHRPAFAQSQLTRGGDDFWRYDYFEFMR